MAKRTKKFTQQDLFFEQFRQLLIDMGVIFPEWRWSLSDRRRIFKFYRLWTNAY